MPSRIHIACLQTRPMPDFDAALTEALALAARAVADGAQLLALPEYCGGLRSDGPQLAPPKAPEEVHPVLSGLREFAKKNHIWLIIGSLAIEAPGGKVFNRGYMVDDAGAIRSRYDKIHLFDVQLSEAEIYRESATVLPGGEAVLVETSFGKVGHTICYDLRFPQLFRDLAQAGAEIITVPSAFTRLTGKAHWHVLNRARAIENGVFIVSPCAIGPIEGGGESYGHSLIVSPWGEVLADGGEGGGVVHAVIDLDEVAEVRNRIPSLGHDRPFLGVGAGKRGAA